MSHPALLALALLAAPQGIAPALAEGESVEVELRADFNADGIADLAYVARGEEMRELRVVTSRAGAGTNPAQVLALEAWPLVPATLEAKGSVLLFEDLNGGTTAIASTHRFRWDAKLGAMRLIGLDAMLYSRTFAHDGSEASWNLLTGDLVTRRMQLRQDGGDQAYDIVGTKRRKKRSPPLRLEDAPGGDALLGWPGEGGRI